MLHIYRSYMSIMIFVYDMLCLNVTTGRPSCWVTNVILGFFKTALRFRVIKEDVWAWWYHTIYTMIFVVEVIDGMLYIKWGWFLLTLPCYSFMDWWVHYYVIVLWIDGFTFILLCEPLGHQICVRTCQTVH